MRDKKIPEGAGFEIDYDKYNSVADRYFETADKWWEHFCLLGKSELDNCHFKVELIHELNGDKLLSMAVNHFVGRHYQEWLDKDDLESLGGLSPRMCLKSTYGLKRLKMLFMMMH